MTRQVGAGFLIGNELIEKLLTEVSRRCGSIVCVYNKGHQLLVITGLEENVPTVVAGFQIVAGAGTQRQNRIGSAGCLEDLFDAIPVGSIVGTRVLTVVRNLQNAAFKCLLIKQTQRAFSRNFTCVTHKEDACSAALEIENQAVIVVVEQLFLCGPQCIGGVEHTNGYVAEVVVQTNVGVDVGCIGIGGLAKFVEGLLACRTRADVGNIFVGGHLIEEIVYLCFVAVKVCKVFQNAYVVALTVGKDPRFDDVLAIIGLRNAKLLHSGVDACGTLVVVVTAIHNHCTTVGKLDNVAHTDGGVVNRLASLNTDLYHSDGAVVGLCSLFEGGKCLFIDLFPNNTNLAKLMETVNCNQLVSFC